MHPDELEQIYDNMVKVGVPNADGVFFNIILEQFLRFVEVASVDVDQLEAKQQARESLRNAVGETREQEIHRTCDEEIDEMWKIWEAACDARKQTHPSHPDWDKKELAQDQAYADCIEFRDGRWERRDRDIEEEWERQRLEKIGALHEEPSRKRQRLAKDIEHTESTIKRMHQDIEKSYQLLEEMASKGL